MENKRKLVISGSVKFSKEIKEFVDKIENKYNVLNYPKPIKEEDLLKEYRDIHKKFYFDIENTDDFLLFNYDKNGIEGYIGYAGFAELSFAITQNLLHGKNISIYILKYPSTSVSCKQEIDLWLSLGWVKIFDKY